jgi:ABC-type multidrug transport system permease subunit
MKIETYLPKTFRKFYGFIKKDLNLLYKRKKHFSIFVLLPIIVAMIFLFALNPTDYSIKAGLCNYDPTDSTVQMFNSMPNFEVTYLDGQNCIINLKEMLSKGLVDIGIVVPARFSSDLENLKQTEITIYYDNTDIAFSNLVAWKVEQSLNPAEKQIIGSIKNELTEEVSFIRSNTKRVSEYILLDGLDELNVQLKNIEDLETDFLTNPISVKHEPLFEDSVGKSSGIVFVFPIITLFIMLLFVSTSVIYDRKSNFLTRVKSSTTITNYLLAKLVFYTILVAIQFGIILILFYFYGSTYYLAPQTIFHLVVSIAVIDSLMGILIGLISENEGIAVLFSLIISFPLMLLSGIFFPTQTLPRIVQWFSTLMPISYQIQSTKTVLLFNQPLSSNWLIGAIILFGLVWWLMRKS